MSQDQQTYQRGTAAAIVGLVMQLLLFISVLIISFWAESPAVRAAAYHFLGGTLIWLMLALLYHQHKIEREEAMEAERLARGDANAAALFEEHADDLDLARRRLERFYKYGLNIVSMITAAYLVIVGGAFALLNLASLKLAMERQALDTFSLGPKALDNPLVLIFIIAVPGFVAFVVARYVAGMTRIREWQLLRGGASYMMGMVCVSVLLAAAAVLAYMDHFFFLASLAVIIPGLMVLIGLEILMTFVLGAYRPRRPGEIPRPAFDSRVLGWFTSPESLGKIIGDTINYQFGFEVSRSWFYRLLSEWVTPLILFGVVTLILISSVVIVAPHQEAVMLKWGEIQEESDGSLRIEGPGLHFKWPWPMGRAETYPVGRVHQISVGTAKTKTDPNIAILWTSQHTEGQEKDFLVTAPTNIGGNEEGDPAAGMSLVASEIIIQYRIADLEAFVKSADTINDPTMLTNLAEAEVARYFATEDVDSLLSDGRVDAGTVLHERIQLAIDEEHLGLEVILVALTGVHPPQAEEGEDVAAAFHEQIGALQEKESRIEEAKKEAVRTLAEVAGTRERALEISGKIADFVALKDRRSALKEGADDADEVDRLILENEVEIEVLLSEAGGRAAELISDARAYRWQHALSERAKAERFASELLAYEGAPRYYRERAFLEALSETMGDRRKIIVTAGEPNVPSVYRLDLKSASSELDIFEAE